MFCINDKGESWAYATPAFAEALVPAHLRALRRMAAGAGDASQARGAQHLTRIKCGRETQPCNTAHVLAVGQRPAGGCLPAACRPAESRLRLYAPRACIARPSAVPPPAAARRPAPAALGPTGLRAARGRPRPRSCRTRRAPRQTPTTACSSCRRTARCAAAPTASWRARWQGRGAPGARSKAERSRASRAVAGRRTARTRAAA